MLIPSLDLTLMLEAEGFPITHVPGDFFVGATEAVPQVTGRNRKVPRDAFFIDSGTAFSPTRFMGQKSEIRYARVLLHLRSSTHRKGRTAMMDVIDFLLGKKFYVHPGTLDNFSDRVVWYSLGIMNVVKNNIEHKRLIKKTDTTMLEYLDVYTTTSDPIHSGPGPDDSHTYTVTYNMVYAQAAA